MGKQIFKSATKGGQGYSILFDAPDPVSQQAVDEILNGIAEQSSRVKYLEGLVEELQYANRALREDLRDRNKWPGADGWAKRW